MSLCLSIFAGLPGEVSQCRFHACHPHPTQEVGAAFYRKISLVLYYNFERLGEVFSDLRHFPTHPYQEPNLAVQIT